MIVMAMSLDAAMHHVDLMHHAECSGYAGCLECEFGNLHAHMERAMFVCVLLLDFVFVRHNCVFLIVKLKVCFLFSDIKRLRLRPGSVGPPTGGRKGCEGLLKSAAIRMVGTAAAAGAFRRFSKFTLMKETVFNLAAALLGGGVMAELARMLLMLRPSRRRENAEALGTEVAALEKTISVIYSQFEALSRSYAEETSALRAEVARLQKRVAELEAALAAGGGR